MLNYYLFNYDLNTVKLLKFKNIFTNSIYNIGPERMVKVVTSHKKFVFIFPYLYLDLKKKKSQWDQLD